MPIRFRCQYCNQLLGISRRKAGTAVRCPTCRGQVIVPTTGLEEPAPGDRPASSPFEGSTFEASFQGHAVEGPPALPFPFQPPPAPSAFDVERVASPTALSEPGTAGLPPRRSPAAGLVLSPTQATFLTVAAILLLALAFGAGLLVGRYVL
jgi:hypothetical protein